MVDFGIRGLHAGGIGEGNGPGYYTLKLGSESAEDTAKQGFKVGREDEGIIQSSFLQLQYCKPHFLRGLFPFQEVIIINEDREKGR